MKDPEDYTDFFEHVAAERHVTAAEVRAELEAVIRAKLAEGDPETLAKWAEIPRTGDVPTPDELVSYMIHQIKRGNADALPRH
jgi:hypothetical protein